MGTKKKCCNVSLYIALVISLLVCCITLLLTSCSYAMTTSELEYYIDSFNADIGNNNYKWTQFYNNKKTSYLNSIENNFTSHNLNFADVTLVRINANSYSPQFYYILGDDIYLLWQGGTSKYTFVYDKNTNQQIAGYYNTGDDTTWLSSYMILGITAPDSRLLWYLSNNANIY